MVNKGYAEFWGTSKVYYGGVGGGGGAEMANENVRNTLCTTSAFCDLCKERQREKIVFNIP